MQNKMVPTLPTPPLVAKAAEAIWDKKGFEVVALRIKEVAQYTDYLVVASATSDRHAVAIADSVEEAMRLAGHKAIGVEGRQQGRWILLDFGDLVVHVFHRPVRDYYEIERLYVDAPRIQLDEPAWLKETSPDQLVEQAGDVGELLWQSVDVGENLDDLEDYDDDSESAGEDDRA